jgi:hypothetical protein
MGWSHVVEEDEGPDHAVRGKRQHAADLEPSQVTSASINDAFDHGVGSGW